jgi:hypothetical protein
MSTVTIVIASLQNTKKQLDKTIDKLDTANNEALRNGVITQAQHSQFFDYIQDLRNLSAALSVALLNTILDKVTVSSDSPAARIKSSIVELNAAIDSIQDTRNLINKIVMAISSVQSFIDILS